MEKEEEVGWMPTRRVEHGPGPVTSYGRKNPTKSVPSHPATTDTGAAIVDTSSSPLKKKSKPTKTDN